MSEKKNYDFDISFTMPANPKDDKMIENWVQHLESTTSDPEFELGLKKYELMSKLMTFLECFGSAIQEAKSIEELENVKALTRTELLKVTDTGG